MTENKGDMELDDIFNKLAKVAQSSGAMKTNKDHLTFEELKEKANSLPNLDVAFNYKDHKGQSKSRDVLRINDSITTVLPTDDKPIRDPTVLKKLRSDKWFALPKVELTGDLKRDLSIIKNRQYLDPKKFYKKDKWEIPERFQIGEVVAGIGEYGGKLKRKQKGISLVEELLHDETSKKWFKKKYYEIQAEKTSGGKKYYQDKISKRRK